MKRKLYIIVLSICLIFSVCLISDIPVHTLKTSASISESTTKPTIIIDCGHGGEDGGATTDSGIIEKDINLKIGLILEKFFLQSNFDVVMIRRTDTAIYDNTATTLREKKTSDIHNRSDICNSNPDNIYISIHQNKFEDSKYFGTQLFYSANTSESKQIAECIRVAVQGLLQNENQRQCKEATSDIYILNKAQVPAVLIECGFLSNEKEAALLTDDTYQKQLAFSIYAGFLEYYYNTYRNLRM